MRLRVLASAALFSAAAGAASSIRTLSLGSGDGEQSPAPAYLVSVPPQAPNEPATLSDPVALSLGVPAEGTVVFNQMTFYTFSLNKTVLNASGDVYVLVTAIDSNPELFVTLGSGQPGPSSSDYASVSWAYTATEAVRINAIDLQVQQKCGALFAANQPCSVNIGIFGSRAGNFSVVVEAAVNGVLNIQPGMPAVSPIGPDGVLIVADYADQRADTVNMAITGFGEALTVLWGSSARGGPPVRGQPATYCALWTSTTLNTNVFHAYNSSADSCWCGNLPLGSCAYYALVYTANASPVPGSSTVYAQWYLAYNGSGTNSPGTIETLLDGVPQGGDLSQGEYGYYIFSALVNPLYPENDVVVTLTPSLGDVDLFITLGGRQPSSSDFDFQSVRGSGADIIEIETQSAAWTLYCSILSAGQPCPVRIAVHGWSIQSSYVITATVAQQVTLLAELPVASFVAGPGDARFFRYYAFSNDNITFSLSGTTGNPWMYVSNDNPAFRPGAASMFPGPGNASSYLRRGTGNLQIVSNFLSLGTCAAFPCTFYIGVVGGVNGTAAAGFTLTVELGGKSPLLPLNVPVYGSVGGGGYDRYTLPWPGTDVMSVVITLDSTTGAGVVLGGFLQPAVTVATADYLSPNYGPVFSRIQIDASTPGGPYLQKCASPSPTPAALADAPGTTAALAATPLPGVPGCPFTVGVFGNTGGGIFAPQTRYVLTAFRTAQLLVDGIPVLGNVEPVSYSQYIFAAVDRAPITITVTPTSGDCDVYVSLNGGAATAGNYQWFSQVSGPGIETITITWREPFWAGVPVNFPFDFQVGVTGWDGPSSYFITAATNNSVATPLVSSVPLGTTLEAGQLTFFSFYVPPSTPTDPGFWTLDVVPLQSAPIGAGNGIGAFVSGSYDFATNTTFPPICVGAGGACQNTSSVAGFAWSSVFGDNPLGVSVRTWGSFPRFRNDMTYIAAVYSPVTVQAVVTATRESDVQSLESGISVPLTLPAGGVGRFYTLRFNGTFGTDGLLSRDLQVEISLTVATGDANLYSSGNETNRRPNPQAFQYASTNSGVLPDTIIMPAPAFSCSAFACDAYIGVFPAPNVGGASTEATLTAVLQNRSGFRPSLLSPGIPAQAAVPAGGITFYSIQSRQAEGSLDSWSFVLSPTSGNPDVYVRIGGIPGTGDGQSDWSSATSGVDSIKVGTGDPKFCGNCTINIAVVAGTDQGGATPAASFALWFAFGNSTVTLLNGVAYAEAALTPLRSRYFVMPVGDAVADVTFSLTGRGIPPVRWFLQPWDMNSTAGMPLPDNGTDCRRTSTVGGVASLTVRGGAAFADGCHCVSCSYVVGAYCPNRACSIGITGQVSGALDVARLADGISVPGSVPRWGWSYYSFDYGAYSDRRNLTITVAPTVGRPTLFATNTFYRGFSDASALPSNLTRGWIWSSTAQGGSPAPGGEVAITIPFNDPALAACGNCSDITVGVWGGSSAGASTFTVTALSQGSLPRLQFGVPTSILPLSAGSARAFEFVLPSADVSAGDLLVSATVYSGQVYLTLDPFNISNVLCDGNAVPPSPNTPGARCTGVWATNRTVIRIPAAAPCAANATNPASASGPCNPAAVWRAGLFYLGAFAAAGSSDGSPARFSLLINQIGGGGQVISLLPGQPVTTYGQPDPAPPTVFVYSTPADAASPPVRFFTLSRTAMELLLFVNSCPASRCTADFTLPGPGSYSVSAYADPRATVNVVIDQTSPAHCTSTDDSDPCLYFLRVMPVCPGGPGTCATRGYFDVFAVTEDGTSPIMLTTPTLIGSYVAAQDGSLPSLFTSTQVYELYTGAIAGGPPVNVTLFMESGGPIFSSLYICDPLVPAGDPRACSQPYAPAAGPGRSSYRVYTEQPSSWWPSGARGRSVTTFSTSSPVVIVGAVADNGNDRSQPPPAAIMPADRRNDGSGAPGPFGGRSVRGDAGAGQGRGRHLQQPAPGLPGANYRMLATTGSLPLVLLPLPQDPSARTIVLSDVAAKDVYSSVVVTLSIEPAVMVMYDAVATAEVPGRQPRVLPLPSNPPLPLKYSVYYAQGSFNPPGVPQPPFMPFTPSGLARWAEAAGFTPVGNMTARTPSDGGVPDVSFTIPGVLPENTLFEFNVVVTCDEACMLLALPPWAQPGRPAAQSYAYTVTAYNTGSGIPPPAPNNGVLPAGALLPVVVGVPLGAVALIGAAIASVYLLRRRSAGVDWTSKGGPAGGAGSGASAGGLPVGAVGASVVPNPLARAAGGGPDGGDDAASRLSARLGHLGALDPSAVSSTRKVALGPIAIGRMEAAPTGVGVDGTPGHAAAPPPQEGADVYRAPQSSSAAPKTSAANLAAALQAASEGGAPASDDASGGAAAGRPGWDSRSIDIARAIAVRTNTKAVDITQRR